MTIKIYEVFAIQTTLEISSTHFGGAILLDFIFKNVQLNKVAPAPSIYLVGTPQPNCVREYAFR